ncbi:MAG: citramalate synthase, partial [Candidatus Neomarinimicrobiota bacterium]
MSEVKIFDTTLRDGSQSENISFSLQDKLRITAKLDEFGVHYIEGGWPGSNPKDAYYFSEVKKLNLKNARIVAFGSTRKFKNKVGDDPNIQALVEAETPTVAIFGKSWILHVEKALKVSPEDNLEIVYDSVRYLKDKGREVIFDAEHFFDGFKDSEEYALKVIRTAEKAGADCIVLCDTNGGTLPHEVGNIVRKVKRGISTPLGIHAHNDSGVAVANSIMAVLEGCTHVQGTFNGYGER